MILSYLIFQVAVKTEPKPEPVDTYRWNMPEKKPQHPILTKQSIPNLINVTHIWDAFFNLSRTDDCSKYLAPPASLTWTASQTCFPCRQVRESSWKLVTACGTTCYNSCLIVLGSENRFLKRDNESIQSPPGMIPQLTILAAQTLEGSLLPSWRMLTLGISGETSIEKPAPNMIWPPRQHQQEGEDRQKWELPVSSRWPVHFSQAAASPASNEKWESNSVASSNSSHFDFSSNTGVFLHKPHIDDSPLRWGVQPHWDQGVDPQRLRRPLGEPLSPECPPPVRLTSWYFSSPDYLFISPLCTIETCTAARQADEAKAQRPPDHISHLRFYTCIDYYCVSTAGLFIYVYLIYYTTSSGPA